MSVSCFFGVSEVRGDFFSVHLIGTRGRSRFHPGPHVSNDDSVQSERPSDALDHIADFRFQTGPDGIDEKVIILDFCGAVWSHVFAVIVNSPYFYGVYHGENFFASGFCSVIDFEMAGNLCLPLGCLDLLESHFELVQRVFCLYLGQVAISFEIR